MDNTNQNNNQNEQPAPDIELQSLLDSQQSPDATTVKPNASKQPSGNTPLNDLKNFFRLTGGSLFYCLSAVCVAYGIVKGLGPILNTGDDIKRALPCIFTLHIYELALLAVLVIIVLKKVVDDALSLTFIIALFLVATSMALGTQATKNIPISLLIAVAGTLLALLKFIVMRRVAKIPLWPLTTLGLIILIASNYFGPILLARSMAADPSQELTRRAIWMGIWLAMFVAITLILIQALRTPFVDYSRDEKKPPFLQTPALAYLFALILLIASTVQQYAMSFTFTLERTYADYVPVTIIASLLALEIARLTGKKRFVTECIIACLPMVAVAVAIYNKSVFESGKLTLGLLAYPPVSLAVAGMAMALWSHRRRYRPLMIIAGFYAAGVILTWGYDPVWPHQLNVKTTINLTLIALILYGLFKARPQLSFVALTLLCIHMQWCQSFLIFAERNHFNNVGGIFTLGGLGTLIIYLIFNKKLPPALRFLGMICLAMGIFDYLPNTFLTRFILVAFAAGTAFIVIWLRTKDAVTITLLSTPILARLYIATQYLAHWRIVAIGFILLAAGAALSIVKKKTPTPKNNPDTTPS